MKKHNHPVLCFLSIVIAIATTFSFASCDNNDTPQPTQPQTSLQRVMTIDGSCGIFNEQVKNLVYLPSAYQDQNADATKTITMDNGRVEKLYYVESGKSDLQDYSLYSSANKQIKCKYDSRTGNLIQISADENTIAAPDDTTTEAEYRTWVEALLAAYGVQDLSGYQYACETLTRISTEDSLSTDSYPYFYMASKSNESIYTRNFTFAQYINNRETTDHIFVHISFASGFVLINFDQNQFANDIDATLDDATLHTVVDACFSDYLVPKYTLASYEIENPKWTRAFDLVLQ